MNEKQFIKSLKDQITGATRYRDGKVWRNVLDPNDIITDAQYEAVVNTLKIHGVHL